MSSHFAWLAPLRLLLKAPPDTQLRAGEELDIALRRLPLACRLGALSGVCMFACLVQLVIWRQGWLVAALMAVSAVLAILLRPVIWLRGPAAPIRLQLTRAGQFRVYCRDGRIDLVGMRPQSLRLGGGVLLVLCGTHNYWLWLAQGNVQPDQLAALHRRLGRVATAVPGLR